MRHQSRNLECNLKYALFMILKQKTRPKRRVFWSQNVHPGGEQPSEVIGIIAIIIR
jgi:hypothetical protein